VSAGKTPKPAAKIRLCRGSGNDVHICAGLPPDRALESPEEALEFLSNRGMLTRTPDPALPSLFEACHEEPYAAGSRGFGSWPATKYPWYFELAERPNVHELKTHNGKSILLTDENLVLVDSICRSELARMEGVAKWAPLLAHLTAAGPSTVADLKTELGLSPRELKSLRAPLEQCGAIVTRNLRVELPKGGHTHTSELVHYDQAYPYRRGEGGIEDLLVAAVARQLSRRSARSPVPGSAGVGCWTTPWSRGSSATAGSSGSNRAG
jgi:hypothetical protein